jgi:hypothetical protein
MGNMELPRYPHFREIRFEDKHIFDDFLSSAPPSISEYTFTNLFIWHHYYHFLWCLWDECICIRAQPEESEPYFMPPLCSTDYKERTLACLSHLASNGIKPTIRRVPEDLVNQFLTGDTHLEINLDRDNCDYVYLTEDLINLQGNRFHGKRNHINHFKKHHSYNYLTLTPDLAQSCLELESEWCNIKHCELFASLLGEERALYEALQNMQHLSFRGGVIQVKGKVEAFALGERLNTDTAVIHIEKANPAFDGLYQLINQEFCANEWADTRYVNREQDLGEEGLRKAKLSYHPHHLVNKYTVSLPNA